MSDKIEEIMFSQYARLEGGNLSEKNQFNIYSAIIQGKILCPKTINCKQHITVDIKEFITSDIEASFSSRVEYDHLHHKTVLTFIDSIPYKYQIELLAYYWRVLKNNSFDNEADIVDKFKRKTIIKKSLENKFSKQSLFNLITLGPSYNFLTLCLSIFVCILIAYVFSLPSKFSFTEFLLVKDKHFIDNFYANRFLNTLGRFSGIINNEFSISPKNASGLMLMILGKLLLYLIIGLNVLRKLEDYFKT